MYVMAGTTWGRMPSLMSTARHVAKRPKQFMKNPSLERFLSVFLFFCKKNYVYVSQTTESEMVNYKKPYIFFENPCATPVLVFVQFIRSWNSKRATLAKKWQVVHKRFITVHQKGLVVYVSFNCSRYTEFLFSVVAVRLQSWIESFFSARGKVRAQFCWLLRRTHGLLTRAVWHCVKIEAMGLEISLTFWNYCNDTVVFLGT